MKGNGFQEMLECGALILEMEMSKEIHSYVPRAEEVYSTLHESKIGC